MHTIELFKKDVYLKKCTANVLDVISHKGQISIILDRTIFFPTGGGQSCDLGVIKHLDDSGNFCQWKVIDVYSYENNIYHVLDMETGSLDEENLTLDKDESTLNPHIISSVTKESPKFQDKVTLEIDWNHRFDNMQRHCGEHILSGMFYQEYKGINRGFHMGDDYMTVDISLEESTFDVITWDMAKHVELLVNKAIWSNLPVVTTHYDSKDEASKEPLRKKLALENDITIVRIGSFENPSDAVACCGTHPSTSGQIGMLKIYKVEVNKGMYRIYFDAGIRAFKKYQKQQDILTSLENQLSAGLDDLLDKYESKEEKLRQTKDKLYVLEKQLIEKEGESLKSQLKSYSLLKKYEALSLDQLTNLGKSLEGFIEKLLLLVHLPSNTLLIFSRGLEPYNCGSLVKAHSKQFNGKGGGGPSMARVSFQNSEDREGFCQFLINHG